jgi:hypothetical protein
MIKSRMGAKRNAYRIFVEKPEGKRPLERPRCRWVVSIKMHLTGIGWGGTKWIYLTQVRNQWKNLVNMVMNLQSVCWLGFFFCIVYIT